MKRATLFLCLVLLIVVGGCTADKSPQPNPSDLSAYDVEIVDVTRTTVTFNVTPKDDTEPYYCYVMGRKEFEDFTGDKYVIATVIQYATEEASNVGMTLQEYMAESADCGPVTEGVFSGLQLDTEYYLLIFSLDPDRAYAAGDTLHKTPFRTSAAAESDAKFEVKTTVVDNSVTFDVTTTDEEIYWYLFTVSEEEYQYHVDPEEGLGMSDSYFYEYHFQRDINSYAEGGYTTEEIIQALIHSGNLQLEAKGLHANSKYLYFIAGLTLDAEGIVIVTDIFKGSYTTGDAARSSMTFEIKVWDIEQMAASVSIIPSNNDDTYCALIQPWDGVSTANEVMYQLVDQWGGWMDMMSNDRGPVEHSGASKFKLPAADTLYYVIAFGYSGGITTDAEMYTFRTLPGGSVEEVEFAITCSNITPYDFRMKVTSSDPTIYYVPGACVADDYDEKETVALEEKVFNYYLTESRKFNPSITVAEVLDQYYFNGSADVAVSGLMPDTEIMGYVYALDVHDGKVVKCFTFDSIAHTEKLGDASPTVELVGYYSGNEEDGKIFGDAAATNGKAITVVKYGNLEGVRTLFTTMVEGDCTNSVAFTDSQLWSITSGFWKTCTVAQPYSFYVADWNVEQTALAYAADNEGHVGTIGRLYTLPTAENKGSIDDLANLVARLNAEAESLTLPQSLVIAEPATPKRYATITPVE